MNRRLSKKVAIIGAGLGGLAVAIALRKLGYDVQVYEKAQDFRPVGAGLGLFPNGLNFLDAIAPGIVETIKNSGCVVKTSVLKNIQGETIRANPANSYQDKYSQPLTTVWWWRLQQILASQLPAENIHLNHRCINFEQDEHSVNIFFENGKKVSADLLIGCDGINSVVRETLIGDGKPRYLQSMSWRTVIKYNQEIINPDEIGFVKGNNQDFMFLVNAGEGDISWVYRRFSADMVISKNAEEAKSRVLSNIADWGESLRSLVEATPAAQISENPMFDRLPLNSWTRGRVTLLGDAAHPMSPSLGQGANSSFEDAYELALFLSQSSTIEEALTNYEQRRIPRLQLIQNRSFLGEMGYYATDREAIEKQMQQQSNMTNEEFQNWLLNYKPSQLINPVNP
ncbi:FAD-dependent monooxygenase [Sphaerospermopsis aphanizomenoides BCCUSP55]|uniref:FAD-dependent oxidoreductase n=1 Tax=Sphaerospermopsis aphanizomenoides TaxID=459663 RepID=UPI0019070D78|nr:FAD-dependent monooxygenase [Sphaerospermopsis aphanizomenoides]MBK1989947.1 FAD-dependent monooxygenase [Sphaerospermopsis aphanizomenoides BCCUSP55]